MMLIFCLQQAIDEQIIQAHLNLASKGDFSFGIKLEVKQKKKSICTW